MGQWIYNEFAAFLNTLSKTQKQTLGINNLPFGNSKDYLIFNSETLEWEAKSKEETENDIFDKDLGYTPFIVQRFENIEIPVTDGIGYAPITGFDFWNNGYMPFCIVQKMISSTIALGDVTKLEFGILQDEGTSLSPVFEFTSAIDGNSHWEFFNVYQDMGNPGFRITMQETDAGTVVISFIIISLRTIL